MKTDKSTFRKWRRPVVALAAILATATIVSGMAGWEHDKWTRVLNSTAPSEGGTGTMSVSAIREANRYIDEPAAWMGSGHRVVRHDPSQVAALIARRCEVSLEAAENLAKMHNVCDMARGSAGVNGWRSTLTRQKEAVAILGSVAANQKLPEPIPYWAIERGNEIVCPWPPPGRTSTRRILLEGPYRGASAFMVIVAVEGGIACYDLSYGNISGGDFAARIQGALIKGGFVGTVVAVTPGGWVTIAGIAAYVAADALVEYLQTEYSTRYTKIEDLRGVTPSRFLTNLQPTMEDYAQGRVQTQAVTMEDYASGKK